MPTTPPTPSGSTIISRSSGSCRRPRCSRNGGTGRGLPICCYLNSVSDSLEGIVGTWNENVWLASRGGGIGTYWGNVRGIGEPVGLNGKTSGIIPFVRVMDSLTLAISQGSLRRGSAACYLDISHPEIEEFLEIRKPSGDFNRKALNLHHGVLVTDEFMEAVRDGAEFTLRSPKDESERGKVDARSLFQKLVETRLATGEPYIIFIDQVNRSMPKHHRDLGLKVSTSNLCSEITLPTGTRPSRRRPHRGLLPLVASTSRPGTSGTRTSSSSRTSCASSTTCSPTISPARPTRWRAPNISAERERRVGLGVMGFHSFLQARNIPFEGAMAKSWNLKIFKHVRAQVDEASMMLAKERGALPRRRRHGRDGALLAARWRSRRPRRSRSSPAAPRPASSRSRPTSTPTRRCRAPSRSRIRISRSCSRTKNMDAPKSGTRSSSRAAAVQHLDFLTPEEKDVFKTSFEIDQRWLIELAADRTPFIDQAQSLNLFIPADVDKWDLMMLHFRAWELGIKSLYYLRSKSVQRAGFAGGVEADNTPDLKEIQLASTTDYDECLACQ